MKRAILMLPMLALMGCSSIQVSTDYDRSASFSHYKSYAWSQGLAAANPLVEQRIHNSIEGQLAAKGLTQVADSPDVLVITHASTSQQTQVNVDTFGYGWGMAGGPTSTTMNVHEISVGTLLVDLVDAKSKQLVWRGIASGAVGVTISQEDMDDVARRVFAGFPPPAGH